MSRRVRHAGWALVATAGLLAMLHAGAARGAGPADAAPGAWWLSAGPDAGGLSLDTHLADYRWDVSPAALWGARVGVGRGGLGAGLRAWRTHTTQGTGLPGVDAAPRVDLTAVDLVGAARLAARGGWELWGSLLAGRLRLDYDPDRLVIDAGGTGTPLTVAYAGDTTWHAGAGLELRRRLAAASTVGLLVERTAFSLETSHRSGDEIVTARERFANWSARLQLAWRWSLP